MKYVRILVLVLAAIVFVAPAAIAQGGGGGGGQGRGRGGAVATWLQGITLTAEQQTQVDSIAAKYTALRAQLPPMQQGQPPDSASMAKRTELNGKQFDEVRVVLTADQQKVFDENRKNNPTGRRGAPPPSR